MAEDDATFSTRLLRTGDAPIWPRLRTLFAERGLDEASVGLATLFTDDAEVEFGIVVTAEGRVFEFDLRMGNGGTVSEQIAAASFTAWEETTEQWRERPFRSDVESALRLVAD